MVTSEALRQETRTDTSMQRGCCGFKSAWTAPVAAASGAGHLRSPPQLGRLVSSTRQHPLPCSNSHHFR